MERPRLRRFCTLGWLACLSILARGQETTTVQGRAIDAQGAPVPGCAVGLFALGEPFDTAGLLAKPLATTDGEGRYRFAAELGPFHIVVVAAEGRQVCAQRLQGARPPVHEMADALMLPGTTLRGRVRDGAGKPIAGAQVRVEDPLTVKFAVTAWFESMASTDDQGIFAVPGVPRTGLRVTVSAPGFAATSRLAAHDSPLDLTLVATGFVRGRVVDAGGRPVPGVRVHVVTVEDQPGAGPGLTDGDGRFAVTAPLATRFRIAAYEDEAPHRQFSSGLLRGPADDVVVSAQTAEPDARVIELRCEDAATKTGIEQFRASWTPIDSTPFALLSHEDHRVQYRGEARIEVRPDSTNESLGTLVVDAPGHGFTVLRLPTDQTEPVVAELPAECFLTGVVLDAETGKPAVGAAVCALPHGGVHGSRKDPWRVGAVTDADGRYRLGGLRDGDYDVQVYGRGRQASHSERVTVSGTETKLDLEVPKARFLEFELVGEVPAGCLGTLEWVTSIRFMASDRANLLEAPLPPLPKLPLTLPRQHRIGPIGTHWHVRASIRLPSRDRLGSGSTIDLGEVRGTGERIELPDLRQFVHRGRVVLPSAVPTERIALVANRIANDGPRDLLTRMLLRPFTVCLGSDGSFVIDLPPGTYALQLADLETGIVFHTEAEDRELGPDTASTHLVVRPAVHWLDLAFEPTAAGGEVVPHGVSLDLERPRGGSLPGALRSGSGTGKRETVYLPWRGGTPRIRCLVGPGRIGIQAKQTFQVLSPTSNGWHAKPVDTAEVDITAPVHAVTLRIPPPPSDEEIVGAAKK